MQRKRPHVPTGKVSTSDQDRASLAKEKTPCAHRQGPAETVARGPACARITLQHIPQRPDSLPLGLPLTLPSSSTPNLRKGERLNAGDNRGSDFEMPTKSKRENYGKALGGGLSPNSTPLQIRAIVQADLGTRDEQPILAHPEDDSRPPRSFRYADRSSTGQTNFPWAYRDALARPAGPCSLVHNNRRKFSIAPYSD
ncbi:hypothetical protein U1Q18_042999 [Sarracenia purpurea var. burkii]